MIDALASEVHYLRHLLPVWQGLPDELRGTLYVTSGHVAEQARERGARHLHPKLVREARNPRRRWIMVASYNDLARAKGRPTVYVEHGAGQTYEGDPSMVRNPWYSGGDDRGQVRLFLSPRQEVADREMARNPGARAVAVGCPALDDLYRQRRDLAPLRAHRRDTRGPTVAVSFHAPLRQAGKGSCPEFGWAWPHFKAAIEQAVRDTPQWRWLGHGHPRAWKHLHRWWADVGAEPCPDYEQVAREADCFVADNTSALYELAALDCPVVVLNSPAYRRNIHHGLRFWEEIPGIQVGHPDWLVEYVAAALQPVDDTMWQNVRASVSRYVYAIQPPNATQAAVDAVVSVVTC